MVVIGCELTSRYYRDLHVHDLSVSQIVCNLLLLPCSMLCVHLCTCLFATLVPVCAQVCGGLVSACAYLLSLSIAMTAALSLW